MQGGSPWQLFLADSAPVALSALIRLCQAPVLPTSHLPALCTSSHAAPPLLADVLLSLTAAHVTGTGPHVAGIILTDAERGVG